MTVPAIRIHGVVKHYGTLKALGGVDLEGRPVTGHTETMTEVDQ